jgi:hypothetical protein
MDETADSIVVKRLVRNLRYRLTYVQIFESFLTTDLYPVEVELLRTLIETQQSTVVTLSRYLRQFGIDTEDLPLYRKLIDQAAEREGLGARLRFIRYGLTRAASWYMTQLMDRQMTADSELRQILLEMGQIEAAKLWRVEAVMAMLRIAPEPEPVDQRESRRARPQRAPGWHSSLMEDFGRPAWKGGQSAMVPRPSHSSHND